MAGSADRGGRHIRGADDPVRPDDALDALSSRDGAREHDAQRAGARPGCPGRAGQGDCGRQPRAASRHPRQGLRRGGRGRGRPRFPRRGEQADLFQNQGYEPERKRSPRRLGNPGLRTHHDRKREILGKRRPRSDDPPRNVRPHGRGLVDRARRRCNRLRLMARAGLRIDVCTAQRDPDPQQRQGQGRRLGRQLGRI